MAKEENALQDIVSIYNGELLLDSGLSEAAFGKIHTRKETGVVATVAASGVTFAPWQFATTRVAAGASGGKDGHVFCSGSVAPAFRTLSALLACDGEQARQAAYAVCTALTAAISALSSSDANDGAPNAAVLSEAAFGAVGAGGILVLPGADGGDGGADGTRVLFLPAEQFERAVCNQSDGVYTALQGGYVKKGLEGVAALAFTRAAIAYRALSGTLPYAETDAALRQTDMYDCNFLPLSLAVGGISPSVAAAVDAGLQMQADPRVVPGEKRAMAKKVAAVAAQRTDAITRFVSANVAGALRSQSATAASAADGAALAARRAEWEKRQRSRIARRRFFRRNRTMLAAMAGVAAVVVAVVISFYRTNQNLPTSTGLTSRQTVETLYTGVQRSDVTIVREVTHGKQLENLLSIVSGVFVTAKQREGMAGQGNPTVTPAEWLFFKNEGTVWVYGLTQFTIDNTAATADFAFPHRRNKPVPLITEEGRTLGEGDSTQHIARYYRVHSDSTNALAIEAFTDTVTLTWRNGRWLVTDLQSTADERTVPPKELRTAYAAALADSADDVAAAVQQLRKRYDWLPTDAELADGARTAAETYYLAAASAYRTAHEGH